MNKIKFMALLGLLLLAGVANADPLDYANPSLPDVQTSFVAGAAGGTAAPSINNYDIIIGFTVTDVDAGWAALFDADTASELTTTNVISEASVAADTTDTIILPSPKIIKNGGVMVTSDTGTYVTIYYLAKQS